ncbi:fimbrial protein (plasmid) [Escherichia coli]|uniref:fimbrial protein n=1 Tax=Escherichia coli TaxID=562 RepID=UPI00207BB06B|nr:fimbrial protein [Escherichia coli]
MYKITFTDASYVRKQPMRRCLNALWLLLFVSVGAIGGDEASQSVDMTFTVNIEPPMCKLDNATLDVDFGEFQIFDIVQGNVKKTVGFNFTDCTNVNNVKISFFGDKVDTNNNVVRNKSGSGYASGVAIGLYDDKGKRMQLKESQKILVNNSGSFDFRVTAAVLKDSSNAVVSPGSIETSVNMNVTYN